MAAEVKLVVRKLEGWKVEVGETGSEAGGFSVEFKWGSEEGDFGLGKRRRSVKMKSTREATLNEDGVVLWDEDFRNECRVADLSDEEALQDLEIEFKVFSSGKVARTKKRLKVGTTSIDLSQWASMEDGKEINLSLPLIQTRNFCGTDLLLCITVTFLKLGIQQESPSGAHKPSVSAISPPQLTACHGNEILETKPGEKKIVVYTRRAKRICQEEGENDKKGSVRNNGLDVFVHHNQLNSNDTRLYNNSAHEASLSELVKGCVPSSAKRKRSERGAKIRRASPLKVIGIEDSEDDVDPSCQRLIHSEPLQLMGNSFLGSTEDSFLIPQWEQISVVSRDALMKLHTQVLFASIDQRSEQAGGSSACSALVVVIANWLHANKGCLPDQCQFDTLIKEGSLEWRELQKNSRLMLLYSDAHFDIKTVLHLRPICVDGAKTTIGFFQPVGLPDEVLAFLPGTTSFDDLWKEISEARAKVSGNDSLIYIVGWNDHFFMLKVDSKAYYIIDTLGERLFEGCDRGFILKFDKETKIYKNPPQDMKEDSDNDEAETETETEILFNGYECCKHYFQSFLAALPLKEAIENNKKGMLTLDRLYGKLQIEFSYTKPAVD